MFDMGIRFCAGPRKKESLILDNDFFRVAHKKLLDSNEEYLSLIDVKNNYQCLCYNDKHLDKYIKYCIILRSSKESKCYIKKHFPTVTIVSFNEIAYYLFLLFLESGCEVNCVGELWVSFVEGKYISDQNKGFIICCEGNYGLNIEECGCWKNSFPENEYKFLYDLYQKMLIDKKIYNKKWESLLSANDCIKNFIESGKPFFAARLGNTESAICMEYLKGIYSEKWLRWIYTTSGFYSLDGICTMELDKYASITIKAIKNCDVHLCRFENEISLVNEFANVNSVNVDWYDLYTELSSTSWFSALKGKRVLIISNLEETIRLQMKKKRYLFSDPETIPDMELLFYAPPQTQCGNHSEKESWFETLYSVVTDISVLDFDIAIIAAGAYGYPLAYEIKNKLKKQAIELCSGIYPLFGIKIKAQTIIKRVSKYYNGNWIFPVEEAPDYYMKIEDGAYWG